MNIRTPQSGKAAKLTCAYLKTLGIDVSHAQALELVARMHGYQNWQTMAADKRFAQPLALSAEGSEDFMLNAGQRSVWLTVDNISVYVRRNDEGVSVDLYPLDSEADESLAGTSLSFAEAQNELDARTQAAADGGRRAWLRHDEATGAWQVVLDAAHRFDPALPYSTTSPQEAIDLVRNVLDTVSLTLSWSDVRGVVAGPFSVFQDNGLLEDHFDMQSAIRQARDMRDAGAGGLWTVEDRQGRVLAVML